MPLLDFSEPTTNESCSTNTLLTNRAFFAATLQYLRLGDNNIHTIPSDALRPLHKLRHLDLRANNISSIAEDAFAGFGDSITFLNLQKNE